MPAAASGRQSKRVLTNPEKCNLLRLMAESNMMTRIHRLFPLVALGAALAGCQTLTPEQQRAADESKCLGYGFKRGTDGLARCLQNIELNRDADARAFQAQAWSNYPFYYGDSYYGRRFY